LNSGKYFAALVLIAAFAAPAFAAPASAAPASAAPASAAPSWPVTSFNPEPYTDDLTLPMPCGGAMAFRPVAVPASGPIGDVAVPLGAAGSPPQDYNDGQRGAFLAAPFTAASGPPIYWIGKYDVTTAQYAAMSGHCPSGTPAALPQTGVSWFDAVAFTAAYSSWLLANAPQSLPARGNSKAFIRLPTETEWEYAARGGLAAGAAYLAQSWAPAAQMGDYAVAGEPYSAGPSPIGSRKPNPLGLYDMLGNAGQWMFDLYQFTRLGRLSGLTGGLVIRGGNYTTPIADLSTSARAEVLPFDPDTGQPTKLADVGFRVVIGVTTGDDAARAAALRQALAQANAEKVNPTLYPLQALPGLENDTADPQMRLGLQAVGDALNKARASTLQEQIDSAVSMTYAIYKIKRDTDVLRVLYTDPEFADLRVHQNYIQSQQNLARIDDSVKRLVDAYSASLQSLVASQPQTAIDAAIAAERAQLQTNADPRLAFVGLTQAFLDKMSQGGFINNDDMLNTIANVANVVPMK